MSSRVREGPGDDADVAAAGGREDDGRGRAVLPVPRQQLRAERRQHLCKGISNFHGARPVHLIITMMKWIQTSRLSIKNSLWGLRLAFEIHDRGEVRALYNIIRLGLAMKKGGRGGGQSTGMVTTHSAATRSAVSAACAFIRG